MRHQLLKLRRGKSTKTERIFGELLKAHRVPFRTKVRIDKYEVDFLLRDRIIVELNGHDQDPLRNNVLISLGYVPMHFTNEDFTNNRESIISQIK